MEWAVATCSPTVPAAGALRAQPANRRGRRRAGAGPGGTKRGRLPRRQSVAGQDPRPRRLFRRANSSEKDDAGRTPLDRRCTKMSAEARERALSSSGCRARPTYLASGKLRRSSAERGPYRGRSSLTAGGASVKASRRTRRPLRSSWRPTNTMVNPPRPSHGERARASSGAGVRCRGRRRSARSRGHPGGGDVRRSGRGGPRQRPETPPRF